ncbi:monooxygenase, partial [Staphylococcus warneri]
WQIHIYGKLTQELKQFAYDSQLPIYHIPWVTQMSQKDIQRDAVFLVRPDGYISVATNSYDVEPLKQMIEKYHIKP